MGFISRFVQQINQGREDAKAEANLRAAARMAYDNKCWDAALAWMDKTPVCPSCKQADGLLYWYQDGMDVNGKYCDDPCLWHAAHTKVGAYGSATRTEALYRIGHRLLAV